MYTDEKQLVSLVDLRSGRVRSEAVTDAPVALKSRRPQIRPAYLCASPVSDQDTARLVVANIWQPEIVVLSRLRANVVAHVVTTVEWLPLVYDSRGKSAPRPPGARMSIACGERAFVLAVRKYDYTTRPVTLREGMVEVRAYNGDIIYRRLWSQEPDSVFFGTPMAARNGRVFFVDNALHEEYPVIHVYRLLIEAGST